jgi:ATP-dependent Clp protease adaptor protein ClpS
MSKTAQTVRIIPSGLEKLLGAGVFRVFLFNCYCHFFEEVVAQIVKAVGCPHSTATQLARATEVCGSITIFKGSDEECRRVLDILRSIGLEVSME